MRTAQITSKKIIAISGVLLVSFYLSLLVSPSHAQTVSRTFTITPPSIEILNVNPGDEKEGVLKVVNDSDEPLTFSLSLQDYIVEDNNGTPKFLTEGTLDNKFSAASWIGVSPTRFTIKPKTREEIMYFLKIPKNARPGGHYAAVTYTPDSTGTVTDSGAAVTTVVGTLLYIGVNGPITEKAEVTEFSAPGFSEYGPVHLHTSVKNFGDLHIRPYGTITIKNIFGKVVSSQVVDQKNIFPLATREYENILNKKWLFGRYTAELTANYGTKNALVLTAAVAFWVIPWKLLVLIILVLTAGVLGVSYLMKKNRPGSGSTSTSDSETAPVAKDTNDVSMPSDTEETPKKNA